MLRLGVVEKRLGVKVSFSRPRLRIRLQAQSPPHRRASRLAKDFFTDRRIHLPRDAEKKKPRVLDFPSTTSNSQGPMHNTVIVATTPTADTGASLVVQHGSGERYFFGNLAEGTQRAMTQHSVPLSRFSNFFVSGGVSWQTVGGLLGMTLTVADTQAGMRAAFEQENEKRRARGKSALPDLGPNALRIFGGRNLVHMLATARCFVFRKGMPLEPHEVVGGEGTPPPRETAEPDWKDANLRVWFLPLGGPKGKGGNPQKAAADQRTREGVVGRMFGSTWSLDALHETMLYDADPSAKIFVRDDHGHLQPYKGPLPGGKEPCENIKVSVRKPWPASNNTPLPATSRMGDAICYIAKGFPQRGKFKPNTALELGVDKPAFSLLTAGKSVLGKNGMTVTPDMVMEPTTPGKGFVLADIPRTNLIDDFLQRPEWTNEQIMDGIEAVYWILSNKVKKDERLVEWIKAHPQQKHFLLAPGTSPNRIALESPAAMLIKMHQIDPDRFSIPFHSNNINMPSGLGSVVQIAHAGARAELKPLAVFKDPESAFMNTRTPVDEILQHEQIMELVKAARQKLADPAFTAEVEASEKDMPTHGVEVVSLGTGSAVPSKYRNVSANLIRVPGYGSYLLDCGENTLGQLRRLYGLEGADEVIKDLHAIYISHAHADHHLGMASVLARRAKLFDENPEAHPVAVIATSQILMWIQEYNQMEDLGLPRAVSTVEVKLEEGGRTLSPPGYNFTPSTTRGDVALPRVEACSVDHCRFAMAVVLAWPSGLKIAYSGDCRPSEEFARMGQGAHLLIHESTFDSELAGEALAKKHSTMAEALEVGRQMRAKKVLLTHFSQRYPKFPNIEETEQTVLFAFDLMRVKLREFKQAGLFLPALQLLFAADAAEDDTPITEEGPMAEGPAQKKAKKEQKGSDGIKGAKKAAREPGREGAQRLERRAKDRSDRKGSGSSQERTKEGQKEKPVSDWDQLSGELWK